MERTNALAELAERLKKQIETTVYVSPQNRKDIVAAQCIVSELAKIEKPIEPDRIKAGGIVHLSEMIEADKNRAVVIVRNCRIIAEEGAGDGK